MSEEILKRLSQLVETSAGVPLVLATGAPVSFVAEKAVSAADLESVEQKCGKGLPLDYVRLLQTLGACRLFVDGQGTAQIAVQHPSKVDELYEGFFDGNDLWTRFLPTCTLTRLQEVGVFIWIEETWKFVVVPHDEHPDDWEDADGRIPNLLGLLREALGSGGDMRPH